MGANGTITKTSWTEVAKEEKVVVSHISEIQAAIAKLQEYAKNVDNCGFTNYCQTCQTVTCQSVTCQGCQGRQRCQSCQRNCNCNCSDCDHGDDS